ncbi:DUF3857 domain-containing protein [Flammeovirga sp. SJP92]|uniref:DUF3857 domain-containing protein n=1 Tax=Flammeovirga sp. SJP92 TaxID=1775430 RepID=UPI0007894CB1|nr:DUF3857 domain-containing protein [Flammeovirga sp. SJP92]KXX68234.1 hypothetical protein AVL50_20790 [Flammeovirga sp. SJP92]
MNKKLKAFFVIPFIVFGLIAHAQTPPQKMKMGKVSSEMVALTTYEKDTSAVAFVIGDFGNLAFEAGQSFFRTALTRHVRIKILKQEGLEYADVLLKYYEENGSKESISSIKGYVYNMVDGQVVKEKLDNDNIFKEEISENMKAKKISFANVKVGSVIEYSYVKRSDFLYSPDDWVAQRKIPTLVSSFSFAVPEYLEYNVKNSRYYVLTETKGSSTTQTFKFVDYNDPFSQTVRIRNWRQENIPAFKEEPFMTSPHDYLARLEMELSSVNNGMKQYTSSWESVLTNLRRSGSCGELTKKTSFMKDELNAIASKTEDKLERAKLVYDFIQKRMTWNEGLGCYAGEGGTRRAYMQRKGNVAEINLMLVAALKEVGVSAFPLMGNVRSGGKVVQYNPALTQLGYIIAYVVDGEKKYFLDATSKKHPFDVLPKRALNYQGVIMSDNERVNGTFVSIDPKVKDEVSEILELNIESDLSIKGSYRATHVGYDAIKWRSKYHSFDEEDEYLAEIEDAKTGLLINEYSVEGEKDVDVKPVEKFDFEWENGIEKAGDALVINPLQLLNIEENPFKLEKRNYPVEFPYPLKTRFMVQINLPEGFSVKELPKSTAMSLVDKKSGNLRYLVSQSGNMITILIDFKVNRLVFGPDEYSSLKRFFDEAYSLQNSPIVLVQNQ